ncbi:MAG: MFS transporter [Cyanobacteria bacterium]|nr:MFS transporter [Cyanobacteriota bacterium]
MWAGQLISNLGTQVSLYALGVWLFQQNGQLSAFAAVAVVVQLAKLASLSLLGRQLDRWPPRRVMLAANGLGSACTLGLAFTLMVSQSSLILVLLCIGLAAAAEAALVVTWSSQLARFVSKEQLGAASGLFAGSDGAVVMAAPLLGALLAATAGLQGVLFTDSLTSLIAVTCTLLVAWPQDLPAPLRKAPDFGNSDQRGVRRSLRALWSNRRWRPLLLINTLVVSVFAAVEIAFPAWVVAASGSLDLMRGLALAALGYAGGLWLWARVSRCHWLAWLRGVLLFQAVLLTGAGLVCFQQWQGVWFLAVGLFAAGVPVALGALQSLWLCWVPLDLQPRLFVGRYGLEWISRLGALLGMSLLADGVIAPLIRGNYGPVWLLDTLGRGPGRPTAMAIGLLGWILLLPLWRLWRPLGRLQVDENGC